MPSAVRGRRLGPVPSSTISGTWRFQQLFDAHCRLLSRGNAGRGLRRSLSFFTLIGFGLACHSCRCTCSTWNFERPQVALWSGVLSGSAALSMALLAPVWGVLADRYGRKPMLVRSMLGARSSVGAMGFVADVWQARSASHRAGRGNWLASRGSGVGRGRNAIAPSSGSPWG